MKSIIYFLLAIMVSSILIQAVPVEISNPQNVLKLHCSDSFADTKQINKSAKIIANRLTDYGLTDFELSVFEVEGSIELNLKKNEGLMGIMPLLTSKTKIEFCETVDRNSTLNFLDGYNNLSAFLIEPDKKSTPGSIIGYSTANNRINVDNILEKHSKKNLSVKFCWNKYQDKNSNYSLYALNSENCLNGLMIKNAGYVVKESKDSEILISFTTEGKKQWSNITRQNIGKTIAIVIDNEVYSTPIVASEIKDGKCIISGMFSSQEAKLLASILNNGILPVNFEIVK